MRSQDGHSPLSLRDLPNYRQVNTPQELADARRCIESRCADAPLMLQVLGLDPYEEVERA
jgi:hypothetical protein